MQEPPSILEADPRQRRGGTWHGAVLLSDEIEYYCTQATPPLIERFDPDHLGAARYNLTLGRRARLGGEDVVISEDNPLTIPPHEVAILSTYEKLNIPRFLIARWALKVSSVYEGLLWVGALQVDPGWSGELFAPVYNLAEHPVVLYYQHEIFAMDFVKTTEFKKASKRLKQVRSALEEFDRRHLRSAPREVFYRLDRLETQAEQLEARSTTFLVIIVAVLGAIIVSLSVIVVGPLTNPEGDLLGGWPLAALTASAASLIFSFAALVMAVWGRRK
jgi:deoxycytidine triphosphate deaminase